MRFTVPASTSFDGAATKMASAFSAANFTPRGLAPAW